MKCCDFTQLSCQKIVYALFNYIENNDYQNKINQTCYMFIYKLNSFLQ